MGAIIRPIEEAEFPQFARALEMSAGRLPTPEALADARRAYPLDRVLALVDGDTVVGGTASDVLELTVPGPAVLPVVRATLTAVLPSHRGAGHATALLAAQLTDVRRRGEVLAAGTTSTPGLVWGVGYGPASRAVTLELTTGGRPAPAADGAVRLLDPGEHGLLPEIFDRHRRGQPGQVRRRPEFWDLWFLDRPLYRVGDGDRFAVVHEDDAGRPQGYLTYRLSAGDLRTQPVATLDVEDLVAVTDAARRALWAYCRRFTQAVRVRAVNVPDDEPLRWTLAGTRDLRVIGVRDFLWLRLVDVAAVLAARRYAVAGRLVLEVADPVLPENAGRYLLEAAPDGTAWCEACVRSADLALDVRDLAAIYLGGTTLTTLARAGRVVELTAGAARQADAMFASAPAPWTVTDW
jgi:predicted acetyltransferase